MKTDRKTNGKRKKTPADYLHQTLRLTDANDLRLETLEAASAAIGRKFSRSAWINHFISAGYPSAIAELERMKR